jgi:hypothetical protein
MAKKKKESETPSPTAQKPMLVLPGSEDYGPLLARHVRGYLKRYVKGQRWLVLHALDACLNNGHLPRPWMLKGLWDAVTALNDGADPNEAFGFVPPKGKHVEHNRKKRRNVPPIMFRIYDLHHRKGKPLDEGTFATVGSEFGYSYKTIKRIFDTNPRLRAFLSKAAWEEIEPEGSVGKS